MSTPLYVPFLDDPRMLRVGLMPLAERDWLEPGDDLQLRLALKDDLLRARHDEVVAALPRSVPAQAELHEVVVAHLLARFPRLYRRRGAEAVVVADHSVSRRDSEVGAIEAAGRLVAEDLCLLEEISRGYVLTAAVLCAPSYWRLAEKIGRPLAVLHDPVPGYEATLSRRVDRIFASLRAGRLVWRANWSITNSPRLFQPSREEPDPQASPTITAEDAGRNAYVRVERQTLRRLPRTGAIVFTIKVYADPLERLGGRPATAAALAAAIEGLSEAEIAYKSMGALREPVLACLRGMSRPAP